MSYEDLLQEGYLCLVEVVRILEADPGKVSDSSSLDRYFSRSLKRRMKMLCYRHYSVEKRKSNLYTIDLSEVMESLPNGAFDEMFFRFGVGHLKALLSPLAGRVLELMVYPEQALVQLAIDTQKRKEWLHQLGVAVYGWRVVRILRRHLAKFLEISPSQLMLKIREIREVLEERSVFSKKLVQQQL